MSQVTACRGQHGGHNMDRAIGRYRPPPERSNAAARANVIDRFQNRTPSRVAGHDGEMVPHRYRNEPRTHHINRYQGHDDYHPMDRINRYQGHDEYHPMERMNRYRDHDKYHQGDRSPYDAAPRGDQMNQRHHTRGHDEHDDHQSGDFDILTDPRRELPVYREGGDAKALNPDLAVVRVIDWLNSETGKKEATRALTTARAFVRQASPDWGMVPFRLWSTLDNGLFKGRLSPAVHLAWAPDAREYDADTMGQTFAPGKLDGRHGPVERIAIQLNPGFFEARANAAREDERASSNGEAGDQLVAALAHQMVHAWFMRASGPQRKAGKADDRLKHGDGFWKIVHAIAELARGSDDERAPRFADTLAALHRPLRGDAGWHVPRRVQALMDAERFDHSVCHAAIMDRRSKEGADAWYKKAAGPAKDATSDSVYALDADTGDVKATPRHEKGSPTGYVEVVWDKKAFDYKRKTLEKDFASLKAKLGEGKRVVTLPRGVDTTTFRILDSFLKSGNDYRPSMSPLPPPGVPVLAPPLRAATAGAGADPLWIDVRAFKLGAALDFPELSDLATRRLNSARTYRHSPLEALAEIYASPSLTVAYPHTGAKTSMPCAALDTTIPDDRLRAWAKRMMLATRPGGSDAGYYASNLYAMDKHCGGAGVQGLVASSQSTELEQDYSLCLTELWKKTPKSMHPPGGIFSGGGRPQLSQVPVSSSAFHDHGIEAELAAENDKIHSELRRAQQEADRLRQENAWHRRAHSPPDARYGNNRPSSGYRRHESRSPSPSGWSSGDDDRLAEEIQAVERLARRENWPRSLLEDAIKSIEDEHVRDRHGREPRCGRRN